MTPFVALFTSDSFHILFQNYKREKVLSFSLKELLLFRSKFISWADDSQRKICKETR